MFCNCALVGDGARFSVTADDFFVMADDFLCTLFCIVVD